MTNLEKLKSDLKNIKGSINHLINSNCIEMVDGSKWVNFSLNALNKFDNKNVYRVITIARMLTE